MDRPGLEYSQDALAAWCERREVARALQIGSAARAVPERGDGVVLVVEFLPRRGYGAYLMARLEMELAELFGRRAVDLRTADDLPASGRDAVLASARVLYARAEE